MSHDYDPSRIEAKWQERWKQEKLFDVDFQKTGRDDKFYSLVMFPYPSGDKLHVGHWYNFAPADSFARYMRMRGKTVFEPMGFDAFGLPAENYAIKTGTPPAVSTEKNVETMIKQLSRIGTMYDWSKTVNTSKPEYYRWTQWLFLQMYKNGLAYKKEANVNWCPSCQTVLANEQVKEGKCERCGTNVVQKDLNQWFWKITQYADRLLEGLDDLDWPEKTKIMQRNWIGRKEGINITYKVDGTDETIVCFTTRPDTNFGATFVVLAPEHPFVGKVMEREIESDESKDQVEHVRWYHEQTLAKTELERQAEGRKKTGVFTGFYAVNGLNGRKMPIWVSDFVLGGFGTGAVVGVPGHDKRDFEFAKEFDIPVIRVVVASDGDTSPIERIEQVQEEEGTMMNSEFLDGLEITAAKKKIIAWFEDAEQGIGIVQYRLRDWLVSRQRYWGAPIPIVYDPEGKPHPIPDEHLPWMLPTDVEFKPTGKSPLTESTEFVERTEKIFGKGWTPEFDTMDTFVCSSFYYLMYLSTENHGVKLPLEARSSKLAAHFIDPHAEREWMPVDMYIGGPEHATMHLIYARFVMMALKDFGFASHEEPFRRLVHQGLITNQGAKMSKSKGNVVSPDSFVERHGSDVFRMYLMFMGPFTDGGDWSDTGIKGISRYVQRVWTSLTKRAKSQEKEADELMAALHRTIKAVTDGLEKLHFNTAIASLMELLNEIEKHEEISMDTAKNYALLLAPLAPHLSDELWEVLGGEGFVIEQKWPSFDPALLVRSIMTIAVQVNGKVRGEVALPADATKEDILAAAKGNENVQKFLSGSVKKEIYVPGKLVNFVV